MASCESAVNLSGPGQQQNRDRQSQEHHKTHQDGGDVRPLLGQRNRIGVGGLHDFHNGCPAYAARRTCRRLICVAVAEGKVQRETRKPPRPVTGAAVKPGCRPDQGGLFLRFGGGTAFPLGEVVGDHPRRFHRGLAELGEARQFALNTLTFAVHEAAQAIEFRDQ